VVGSQLPKGGVFLHSISISNTQKDDLLHYLPMVKRIVKKIDNNDCIMDDDDLEIVGFIGLMDAMERYDTSKNVPFESYAVLRIRGTVIDELRKLGKVSRSRIRRLNKYYQTKEKLEYKLLRVPSESEICKEMGIDNNRLHEIHETAQQLSSCSLDSNIASNNGDDFTLLDVIKDESDTPDELLIQVEEKDVLIDAINKLEERERILLNLYYVEELSFKEIAYILNISIPRVSQIHKRVLSRLKDLLEREYRCN
jgi:RNA polymerase sigma factor for flagellar operon FliA